MYSSWMPAARRAEAPTYHGGSSCMQSSSEHHQTDSFPQRNQAKQGNNWRFKSRKPLGDTPFFTVAIALYDTGLARHLRSGEFKRYCTLLRIGNYSYGSKEIAADLQELRKLDGLSARASWRINRRLAEYRLIQVLRTRPFTYLLLQPESWLPPKNFGPKITQGSPLKVTDKDFLPSSGWVSSGNKGGF